MSSESPPADAGASVYSAACPSRAALDLVAGKWPLLIIPALADGALRNGELLRRIEGLSQKVLTQTLRELERNGLVVRTEQAGPVPTVDYRLSPLGRSLSDALVPVDRWAEQHHAALAEARGAYDRRWR